MIPSLSLRTDGLFDTSKLQAWTDAHQRRIRAGVKRAFQEAGKEVARQINAEVAQKLKIKRKAFPAFRAKVYDAKLDRLPALRIYSKIPWLGIFTHGGTVRGKGRGLLIPLLDKRMGPKAFRRVIDTILRNGSGFWKQVNGKVILFAEYQPEYGQPLARFRRAERTRRGGGRIRAGEEIPIAVLVPSVTLAKRFDPVESLRRGLPRIVSLIEQNIALR